MNRIVLTVFVVEAILGAVGLAGAWWFETPILEDMRVDLRSGAIAIVATIPLLVVSLSGLRSKSGFGAELLEVIRKTLGKLFASCSVIDLLIVSIMAGIGEELFFRGFLQASLGNVIHPWLALVLVSILFGVVHWASWVYALSAGLIGLFLGVVFLVTGNLFVAIAVHALYDFFAMLVIVRMLRPLANAKEDGTISGTISTDQEHNKESIQ
jgi:hypothetical protein